jgi:hypothetical protein
MFAMVAISDYDCGRVGNTMRETLTSFKTFTIWDNKINPNSVSNKKSLKSVVPNSKRCQNGNSFYYFKVKDYPNIFCGFIPNIKSIASYNSG